MSKSLRVSALLLVCLSLIAFPVFAGQADDKAPTFSVSVGVPNVRPLTDQDKLGKVLDISRMPVLLDGVVLPEGLQTKQAVGEFYLVIDDEQGVINAFRTHEEFKAHLKASGKLACSNPTTNIVAPGVCIFWNVSNCDTPPVAVARAVAMTCGTIVPNITALLGGPIQSFDTGCNGAVLIPAANCSTTPPNPPGVSVTPGGNLCFNISVPNPFNCAGCLP
ncbi:MAG TPA: hypothetical protein VGS07_13935 [Thermoanaerobaculia bacterium]|jgi:hypothetical protein|nr:hypothetical protein [Thermoanaerobaculia bacterium]